ncbi:hypothetical protein ACIBEA_40345 [Streptomyces sp. NPDC051555]
MIPDPAANAALQRAEDAMKAAEAARAQSAELIAARAQAASSQTTAGH